MTTKELQKTIIDLIGRLEWSVPRLAEVIYTATCDEFEFDEAKLRKFEDSLKKQLTRSTTNAEKLEKYLDIISQDREFQKQNIVVPYYITNANISDEIRGGMNSISKKITQMVESSIVNDIQ